MDHFDTCFFSSFQYLFVFLFLLDTIFYKTMFITSPASTLSAFSQPTSLFPISFHLIQAQPCCAVFSHLKWSEWLWLSEFRWRNLSTLQFSLLSEDVEKLTSVNVDEHIVEKEVIICNPYSKARTLIFKNIFCASEPVRYRRSNQLTGIAKVLFLIHRYWEINSFAERLSPEKQGNEGFLISSSKTLQQHWT